MCAYMASYWMMRRSYRSRIIGEERGTARPGKGTVTPPTSHSRICWYHRSSSVARTATPCAMARTMVCLLRYGLRQKPPDITLNGFVGFVALGKSVTDCVAEFSVAGRVTVELLDGAGVGLLEDLFEYVQA